MAFLQPTGDYGEQHHIHQDKSAQQQIVAGDAGPFTLVSAKAANFDIYVQRIFVSITTFAAKTWTFQDTANTPVPIGVVSIPAAEGTAQGLQTYQIDFGPHGFKLTTGKNLSLALSAAGAAGVVTVDAYQKLRTDAGVDPALT